MRDDEARAFATVTFPLPDEDGHPVEICTIGTDVTERRERESERRIREEWRDRIFGAIDAERMLLYAQPVVQAGDGTPASCELLVRMRSEEGDVLPPGAFLPVAERFGPVQQIDAWVVRRALTLARGRRLAVNVSAVTLDAPRPARRSPGCSRPTARAPPT